MAIFPFLEDPSYMLVGISRHPILHQSKYCLVDMNHFSNVNQPASDSNGKEPHSKYILIGKCHHLILKESDYFNVNGPLISFLMGMIRHSIVYMNLNAYLWE